ncbi:MAG: NAD(P)-binding protein [Pseudomonadota bacterium]
MIKKTKYLIIGAGLTGLTAAYFLADDYLIVEREDAVGGLVRTDARGDFLFDYTGHWLHIRNEYIKNFIEDILDTKLLKIKRNSKIYSNGSFTEYPFQSNLYGLAPEIKQECLFDFMQAYDNKQKGHAFRGSTFMDYIRYHFGQGIAKHFMIPYNTKVWGVSPGEMTAEWCSRFVPIPRLDEVLDGARGCATGDTGYNACYYYPPCGGIGQIPLALSKKLKNIYLNTPLEKINIRTKTAQVQGFTIAYEHEINTSPLDCFIQSIETIPAAVRDAGSRLRCTSLDYVNVGIGKPVLDALHWVYFPERQYPFYRIGVYSNAVACFAPAGKSALYVEVVNGSAGSMQRRAVMDALYEFLQARGYLTDKADIEFVEHRHIAHAYVLYDFNYSGCMKVLHEFLDASGSISIGRYGSWNYSSMEDSMLQALQTARQLKQGGSIAAGNVSL